MPVFLTRGYGVFGEVQDRSLTWPKAQKGVL